MAKRRRTGGRGMARNVFAAFWIALGGVSGFYLFTLFTDPTALGNQAVQVTDLPDDAGPAPVAPAPQASMAGGADSAEVTALEGTVRNLSQQLATLDARLKPIEHFIGPVAALPPSASVSTSKPQAVAPKPVAAAPEPEPEPEPEMVEEEVVEETVVETPPPPPPVAAAPEPEPEPEPVAEAAPEPEPEAPAPPPPKRKSKSPRSIPSPCRPPPMTARPAMASRSAQCPNATTFVPCGANI